uniref:ATP-dependent DNA ligase family profile domain-containing protein n=1 Tax=Kwoniella pini CBS 10737 TaxID=1296096 RepID=A0A1B9HXJ8_9TREE|nr:uncharacterized protein I206_05844 [Kwoniella pini CBS 10737]OCF47978.1 hypothetical protein I206_05844 [Kwoniella pini CBS 10737]
MDIPFESFAKLVFHLGNPPKSTQTPSKTSKALSPIKIFQSWLNHLAKPFPPGTGKHLFRLLYPHEGSRRRYGLKEAKLALELGRIMGVEGLSKWDCVTWDNNDRGTGCLGKEIELAIRDRSTSSKKSTMTIRELDLLLDELATSSSFSQLSQNPSTVRAPQEILLTLYRESNLSPYGLCVLTQIILRDLRPLLNPLPKLPIRNPTTMLRLKSNTGPEQLTLRDAMICWDKRMWDFYTGGTGNIDVCADMIENLDKTNLEGIVMTGPKLGTNVKVGSDPDNFTLQIHVTCSNGESSIKIYSKSTRDSTEDRLNTHSIILASLSLPVPSYLPIHHTLKQRLTDLPMQHNRKGISSIILEAEVCPYNESSREGGRAPGIEEFWWLGHAGVTTEPALINHFDAAFSKHSAKHLCLIFFDVLYLNGQSLIHRRYEDRRIILEQIVQPIQGFSHLAERTRISLDVNRQSALQSLEEAFRRSCQRREEGLVLKASGSTYTNMRWQWVKLKKDYIPNLGDCIDLVLLGAGWDIDRARDLRVDTSVFTTFYLGVLTNPHRTTFRKELPNFEILFKVSYGPDRTQLDNYNECLRYGKWGNKPFDKDDPFKRYYEIRWPRLQKIYEPSERQWVDALSAQDLIKTAHQSLGYNIPTNSTYSPPSGEDSIRAMWRSHSTINLIDIPQLVSPTSPKSPKRVKSEPNIALLRDTSPSPFISHQTASNEFVNQAGRKLNDIMTNGIETSRQPIHPTSKSPEICTRNAEEALIPEIPNIPRPITPNNTIILGPPLPITPRKSPHRIIAPHISPVKRLISSIDWTNIDIRNQSTPNQVFSKRLKLNEIAKEKVKKNQIIKPLSLRSRLKLISRRIGLKS